MAVKADGTYYVPVVREGEPPDTPLGDLFPLIAEEDLIP